MTKDKTAFVERLRAMNVPKSELRAVAEVSYATINGWLNGKTFPRRQSLVKLAKALNVTPAWLRGE